MHDRRDRPLLIIFLTIFVNLVGFGIIIPLLPFYAETFGASPFIVGLLFAVFSLCQLVAAPVLGDLSDRYGRRPVLIFSLAGTVVSFVMLAMAHSIAMLFAARIVDGLSGGNISTARAYVADITEPKDRARAYGIHRRGLRARLHPRPGAERRARQGQLHGADLGGRRDHGRRHRHGVAVAARNGSPGARGHRQPVPVSAGAAQAPDHPARARDRLRLTGSRSRSSKRRSRCSWPRGSASTRRRPGISSPASECSARSSRADSSGRSCGGWATRPRSSSGLVFSAIGLAGAAVTHSVPMFVLIARAARARDGLRACRRFRASSVARPGGDEQGRVQGAASAVESLGRTLGPVWGAAVLQRFGEAAPYMSAAAFFMLTWVMTAGYHVTEVATEV